MIPRKNVGRDHMKRLKESAPTSIGVRRFHAAMSPRTTPNPIESTCEGRISHSVLTSAPPSRSITCRSRKA
jgi:hypothetical protein